MSERFRLDLREFEGPLDLLLYLIRRDDLDILNLSVAEVAEQYLDFVERMQQLDLDVASEYLVMAATLAWMKSRLMLPRVQPDDDEIADLRAELIERLLAYERYKQAAEQLEDRPLVGRELFLARAEVDLGPGQERPWAPVSVFQLMEALSELIAAMPEASDQGTLQFVLPERTVEQGAAHLKTLLDGRPRLTLRELLDGVADRNEAIVRFLALLELINLGELVAVIESSGGEIHIARRHPDAPLPDYPSMVKGTASYGTDEDDGDR